MGSVSQRSGLGVLVLTVLLVLVGMAGTASANSLQDCAQIPIVGGIPPWEFHTGPPITGATGSYAVVMATSTWPRKPSQASSARSTAFEGGPTA